MSFTAIDYVAFVGYIIGVVIFAMYMSRREETSEDYFLAGRKLTWFLIGISLIASNISTEHFVGMAGAGYDTGLAIACYEWTAAVAIVLVGIFLLPKFLQRGIYTIPEFLEYRYSSASRGLMAFYMMAAYVFVIISAVLYSGAIGLDAVFGDSIRQLYEQSGLKQQLDLPGLLGSQWVLVLAVWVIGLLAGLYTVWGGLKAVVWADLWNGLGLILGGVLVTILGLLALSSTLGGGSGLFEGLSILFARAGDKLSAVKPWDHPEVPWIAVFLGGLWIPQFFYWGLNQFITQRALGAKSVAEGQKGLMFAATIKLIMPFIIIFPGIMAFELYAGQIDNKDKAYPHMIQAILLPGLRGVMLAALFGAVMSSLDSMLNSASTILTIDLYKRHLNPQASDRSLMRLGRWVTAAFVLVACLWAPQLGWIAGGKGVFDYIQKTWGFITPGIVTVFFFGLLFRKASSQAAVGAMLLGPAFYMWCLKQMPEVAFLHHMAFTFIVLTAYMFVVTLLAPLRDAEQPSHLPAPAVQLAPPRGVIRRVLIPYGTMILGGYWMAVALFQFNWRVLTRVGLQWGLGEPHPTVVFAATLVPTAIYCLVARALMCRPFDLQRRVIPKSEVRRSVWSAFRPAFGAVAAIVFAAVVGLHTYMFTTLVWQPQAKEAAEQSLWQQLWQKSIDIPLPSLWRQASWRADLAAQGNAAMKVSNTSGEVKAAASEVVTVPVEPADPSQPGTLQAPSTETAPAPAVAAANTSCPDAVVSLGHLTLGYRTVRLLLFPLCVAVAVGVLFFLACVTLRIMARRPEVLPVSTVSLDLTPSVIVPIWGLLIVAAALAIYYFFF